MAIVNPPGWIQALSTHTAAQLRSYITSLQAGNAGTATALIARGGVHTSLGQELVVTQAGSPNMTVLVESGMASIPGQQAGTQGNYIVMNDAQVTLSIAAAHASLARFDIVVINIRDAFYSGANNDVQLQVITGTPASSPVAPTPPDNSITLAQITVGAGVSSITNANIADSRHFMAAAGGVISSRNEASRPTSAEIAEGQLAYSRDNDKLWLWDGTNYNQIHPGFTKISESILGSASASVTFSSIPSTFRQLEIHAVARGSNASGFVNTYMRFNSDSTAIYDYEEDAAVGSSPGAAESLSDTGAKLAQIAGASAIAGSCGIFVCNIPWYTGTTFWKTFTSNNMLQAQTTSTAQSGQLYTKQWTGRWRSTSAITSITIFPETGNFITGSSFALYGLP